MTPNHVYFVGLAVLALLVAVEWARHPGRYRAADSLTNIAMYGGYLLVGMVWLDILFRIYYSVWEYRIFDFGPWWLDPSSGRFWLLWGALFLLEDFCFYLFHRTSHRLGFLWAAHVAHHSSRYFNLTTALRQSWFPFITFVFWLPLPLIGFDPLMVISMQLINLAYQALLHSETDPWPRWFGWLFNTPTHHRIHHASNPDIIDRNFGGILIVWDRLFGTFKQTGVPLVYGVTPDPGGHNPVRLQLHGWFELLQSWISRDKEKI